MAAVIGIDLGTTNSCVAVFQGGQGEVLENAEGSRTTPSVVAFGEERLVGDIAKRQAVANPERTISSVKRFMGRKVSEVGEEEKIVPYALASGPGGDVRIDLGGELVSPPEVSAILLRKLKEDAEAKLGEEVEAAVVTVPAYFNDDQRQATKDAGRIAGLEIERIINEPTAAALAYGLDKREEQERILVFDLGGGTFDVSVLEISDGVFEVLATAGDNHLGGDNWDKAIVDWLLGQFAGEHGLDLSGDKGALQRLYEAAEKAKRELSSTQSTHISLPFLSAADKGPLHLERDLSRAEFLRITDFLLRRIERPLRQALEDAEGEVDHVILVGGMTRIPAVQERLEQITGKEPRNDVHPDEVVALGAAVQAAALRGQVRDVLLLDVTPLSLGIETRGGVVARLLERNTTIPSRVSETFSTAEDNQTEVEIHVLQGESDMASLNKSLGCLLLQDIPPARRGEPQIEVEFDIDVDGILHVQAQDKSSGRKQEIVIHGGSGLSEEEVQAMIARAEANAEADRQARERAETHNLRESYIYAAEHQLAETEGLPGAVRAELEADLQILRQAPLEEVPERIENLRQRFLRLSQKEES